MTIVGPVVETRDRFPDSPHLQCLAHDASFLAVFEITDEQRAGSRNQRQVGLFHFQALAAVSDKFNKFFGCHLIFPSGNKLQL